MSPRPRPLTLAPLQDSVNPGPDSGVPPGLGRRGACPGRAPIAALCPIVYVSPSLSSLPRPSFSLPPASPAPSPLGGGRCVWRIIQHGLFERLTRTPSPRAPSHTHTHTYTRKTRAATGPGPRQSMAMTGCGPLAQSGHCHWVPEPINGLSLRVDPRPTNQTAVKAGCGRDGNPEARGRKQF